MTEVELGCGLDAVGVVSQVDRVEIKLENLVFGELSFHLVSVPEFDKLSPYRYYGAIRVELACDLLRD